MSSPTRKPNIDDRVAHLDERVDLLSKDVRELTQSVHVMTVTVGKMAGNEGQINLKLILPLLAVIIPTIVGVGALWLAPLEVRTAKMEAEFSRHENMDAPLDRDWETRRGRIS